MKKNILFFLFLGVVLFLSACGVKHSQQVVFDGKSFLLETQGQEYIKVASVDLPDFYLGENIKASYLEVAPGSGNVNDFLSSFVFVQRSLSREVSVDEFYQVNREELPRHFESLEAVDKDDLFFFCGNKQIGAIRQSFTFTVSLWEKEFYVVQYFYVYNDIGTVISFVSDEEEERKDFSRSLDSFACAN